MKKLFFLNNTMGFGGAEVQTLELCNGLVDLGYDINIAVLTNKDKIIGKARPEIKIHMLNKKSYLDFAVVREVRRLIESVEPSILLCVDLYPLLFLHLALRRIKDNHRTAVVFHSTLPQDFKENLQRSYLAPMASTMERLIFVSYKQMLYWIDRWKLDPAKAVVIHNGINLKHFLDYLEDSQKIDGLKQSLGLVKGEIVIGNCSNFRKEKRHQDLLEALARLLRKGYRVKLLLIGDGYMRGAIENKIREMNLENEVIITGFLNDVRPYLAAVDIFALTSDAVETLSIAAIEGQAMKKAVVSSDIGGAAEIVVNGESGYLYPAGNIEFLTEKLEKIIIEKKWRSMGEAGFSHARKCFDRESMINAYHGLFEEMMAAPASRN